MMSRHATPSTAWVPRSYLGLILLGGLLLAALISFSRLSPGDIKNALAALSIANVTLFFILYYAHILLASTRWEMIITAGAPEQRFPLGLFMYTLALGQLAKYLPASSAASAGAKIAGLKLDGDVRYERSFLSILVEWVFNLTFLIILGTVAVLRFNGATDGTVIFSGICLILTAGAALVFSMGPVLMLFASALLTAARIFHKGALADRVLTAMGSEMTTSSFSRLMLAKIFLYTCLFYLVAIARLWLMANLFAEVTFVQMLTVFPVMMGVSLLAFTPGGLGVVELGWTGAMIYLGMGAEQALAFALLKRIMDDPSTCVIVLGSKLTMAQSSRNNRTRQTTSS